MKKILVVTFAVAFSAMGLACGTEADADNPDVYGVEQDQNASVVAPLCSVTNGVFDGKFLMLPQPACSWVTCTKVGKCPVGGTPLKITAICSHQFDLNTKCL
jgi:hypothetical protein